jgi:hypothetical protein
VNVMANVRGSRAPADLIQRAVEQYVAGVFASGDDDLPDAPLSELDDVAMLLAATFRSGDLPALRQAVGAEFIERLSRRWAGSTSSRMALALRHAADQITQSFPVLH